MVPGVRSSGGDSGGEFDVNSPSGVVAVLAAIRTAELTQTQRNELRDLVFLYTRGNDEAVKVSLLKQLEVCNIHLVPEETSLGVSEEKNIPETHTSVEKSVETKVMASTFQSRPVPRFAAPVVLKETPVVSEPLNVPMSAPVTHDVVAMTTPAPLEEVVANEIPHLESEVLVAEVVEPVQPIEPATIIADIVEVATTPIGTSDARSARIQEIKATVNQAFGNPVNLVEIDNTLGREYMSSLLEAMKLSPEAEPQVVAPVMERLENIFRLVEARVEMVDKTTLPHVTAETPVPFVDADIPEAPQPETVPVTSATRIVPIPVRMRDVRPEEVSVLPPPPDMSSLANATIETTTADVTPIVTVENTIRSEEVPLTALPLQSVAQTPVLKTLADLPTADALERSSVVGDVLFTQDVDDGMDQLLSEWSLFKKSGLFGTGPKGHLHPLFMKLAPLQIPLIMSGRFEGSSEEIKQSISDYMNGWRYEQGIIFENNETFEHYLRRVIRHIIDLQKKRRGS